MSEILVKVARGNQIESIHRGHIVVANAEGEILYHLGDSEAVLSLFKPCLLSPQALQINSRHTIIPSLKTIKRKSWVVLKLNLL
jgi:L-asparaginase II